MLTFAMETLGMSYESFWHETPPRRLLTLHRHYYAAPEEKPMSAAEVVAQVKAQKQP